MFYNKLNDSLITVSVYERDSFALLKCKSTPIKEVLKGNISAGVPVFSSEMIKFPGFVEFDDVNGKVLTFSATNMVYKVWSLRTYEKLYEICSVDIQEIKVSPGIMLLIYSRSDDGSQIYLRILAVETGETCMIYFSKLPCDLR